MKKVNSCDKINNCKEKKIKLSLEDRQNNVFDYFIDLYQNLFKSQK